MYYTAPFADAGDLARRAKLKPTEMTLLASAGALACFGKTRREALCRIGPRVPRRYWVRTHSRLAASGRVSVATGAS